MGIRILPVHRGGQSCRGGLKAVWGFQRAQLFWWLEKWERLGGLLKRKVASGSTGHLCCVVQTNTRAATEQPWSTPDHPAAAPSGVLWSSPGVCPESHAAPSVAQNSEVPKGKPEGSSGARAGCRSSVCEHEHACARAGRHLGSSTQFPISGCRDPARISPLSPLTPCSKKF